MNTATINYLGRLYSYPLLTAEDLAEDRVVRLNNFESSQQGYELCYTETRRSHFLIRREELARFELNNPEVDGLSTGYPQAK